MNAHGSDSSLARVLNGLAVVHCLIIAEILVQMSLRLTDNTSLLNIGCLKGHTGHCSWSAWWCGGLALVGQRITVDP